ncbi:MAG: UDP-N-acetylmuramoyl-L-alanyl-D-glutamate--2,6-diaminopimelate ligase [Duodenibacillus sp.]|nr:UDP-N-acetylmuramoyl-L-alanyl-D-glutamate--2,6-diaminopimelate ligase [Duodenibacillus sp.]
MTDAAKDAGAQLHDALAWLRARAGRGGRLCIDSRDVRPGDIFVALKGARVDGLAFAPVAAAHGAKGILMERRPEPALPTGPLPRYELEGLGRRLGEVAADFYGRPSERMMGIAVTGTNGKTSCSHWIAQLLTAMHHPCAAVGTIGCYLQGRRLDTAALTTPDAVSMHDLLARLYAEGCQAFALEASSIGLAQGRLQAVRFHTAVFTNLTRDHLDYHGTMQAYEEAKAELFAWPRLRAAVINADDPAGLRLIAQCKARKVRVIAYTHRGADIEGCDMLAAGGIRLSERGCAFAMTWKGKVREVRAQVVGDFNVMNLLAAAGAALSLGMDPGQVAERLAGLRAPAGRMQMVAGDGAPLCVIDYAHTPDAVEKALAALKGAALARGGRITAVLGAGGDRDPGKRAMMGRIAALNADAVVVTSDNPRSEDPAAIAEAVAAGAREAAAGPLSVILDRRQAIVEAVCASGAADIVLIAGKGHEDYQEVQGVKRHFSDVEVAREAVNEFRVRARLARAAG